MRRARSLSRTFRTAVTASATATVAAAIAMPFDCNDERIERSFQRAKASPTGKAMIGAAKISYARTLAIADIAARRTRPGFLD